MKACQYNYVQIYSCLVKIPLVYLKVAESLVWVQGPRIWLKSGAFPSHWPAVSVNKCVYVTIRDLSSDVAAELNSQDFCWQGFRQLVWCYQFDQWRIIKTNEQVCFSFINCKSHGSHIFTQHKNLNLRFIEARDYFLATIDSVDGENKTYFVRYILCVIFYALYSVCFICCFLHSLFVSNSMSP